MNDTPSRSREAPSAASNSNAILAVVVPSYSLFWPDTVTFNVAGNKSILPSKDIVLKGNNADNYELKAISLSGEISKRTLIVTSQISKYYDGTNTIDLTDYSATGLLTEETVPTVTATFTGDANVGLDKDIKLALKEE